MTRSIERWVRFFKVICTELLLLRHKRQDISSVCIITTSTDLQFSQKECLELRVSSGELIWRVRAWATSSSMRLLIIFYNLLKLYRFQGPIRQLEKKIVTVFVYKQEGGIKPKYFLQAVRGTVIEEPLKQSTKVITSTTKDCKGPQTNMPENVGSIKT